MASGTAYAAFLRGINLGPVNKISMATLRGLAEGLGYGDVATYINSGNLIFTSTKRAPTLAAEVSRALRAELPKTVDVAVRSRSQLERLLAHNPFPDGDPSKVCVAFLMAPPLPGAEEKVRALAGDHEPVVFDGSDVWVHYSQGLGTSTLAEQFAKIVGGSATTRTVRTVQKVLDLMAR